MASYPAEPFKQADSLLSGLIDSYRGSRDAADMADIQSMVETTVKIARDREFRVLNTVKELTGKVASAEASAVYSDAKAAHEERLGAINASIADAQQALQHVNSDLRGASDQQASLQAQHTQLQAAKDELSRLQRVAEPDKLHRISLYAHITGLSFDYASLDKPVTQATLSDSSAGQLMPLAIDHAAPRFDTANRLWGQLACPPAGSGA